MIWPLNKIRTRKARDMARFAQLMTQLISLNNKIDKLMSVTDDVKADVATLGGLVNQLITALQAAVAKIGQGTTDGISAADAAEIKASLDAEIAAAQAALAPAAPAPAPAAPAQ